VIDFKIQKIKNMNKFLIFFLLGGFLLTACGGDDDGISVDEELLIDQYMTDNNLTADFDDSGMKIIILQEGNGTKNPVESDLTHIKYKGITINGDDFVEDTTGISFKLQILLEGWKKGIPYLTTGGKGIFIMPSSLAYGENPPPNSGIGKNEPVVFEIELLDINDELIINNYLSDNSLTGEIVDESGVVIVMDEEGTGTEMPSASSNVTVKYKGYEFDGVVFDENTAGVSFNLDGLIEGWKIGIPYFKKGGKGRLFIPACLAYGENPPGDIGYNAPLIFEIELVDRRFRLKMMQFIFMRKPWLQLAINN